MVLGKLRKLFRGDNRAHMHPRESGGEPITCQCDETLRKRNVTFHVNVSLSKD